MHPLHQGSIALLLLPALAACGGGSNDGGGGAGGVGAAGNGAAGASSLGGAAAGSSSTMGGSTMIAGAGSGGNPSAGSPSGGSTGGGTSALDPTIPPPSYDCVADTTTKACAAIRGTFHGMDVDKHCARASSPLLLLKNPDAWPAACDEQMGQKTGWFFQIAVPVGDPGPFDYKLAAGDDYVGADVVVVSDTFGGDFRASNLLSGEVAGTIEVNAAGDHIAYGTFRAAYGPPDVLCNSSFATECAEGRVTGTFRVQSPLGGK